MSVTDTLDHLQRVLGNAIGGHVHIHRAMDENVFIVNARVPDIPLFAYQRTAPIGRADVGPLKSAVAQVMDDIEAERNARRWSACDG